MTALAAPLSPGHDDPATWLWDGHFGDPEPTLERVRAVLAAPDRHDAHTLAWAELTEGFHHLFFTGGPGAAREWLDRAGERFVALGDRRGALLVDTGRARLLIHQQQPLLAREMLLTLQAEAMKALPPQDAFWVINALCATYYYTDRIDDAVRTLYEALELLRTIDVTPQLVTVLSNLAAALVTIGDYSPARELADEAVGLLGRWRNPQLMLYARSNLAEAQLGTGDADAALQTVVAMLADGDASGRVPQNHYCAIAAEVFAAHGRFDEADRAVALASDIERSAPGGFNEVHLRWAEASVAAARDAGDSVVPALRCAAETAARHRHVMTMTKAQAALAQRLASLGRYEEAYAEQGRLLEVKEQRLVNRASARYYLLRVEHELSHARAERDSAMEERRASQTLNRELAEVNAELSRKMREIEELQSRLAAEAVHDPLTQLLNRRYLDSAMPSLGGAADRRGTPLTLALIDLDHFKRVNDEHGHLAGDKVLRHIARLFAQSVRPADIVARWGGEEFCIVFPDTDTSGAAVALATLATRLRSVEVEWGAVRIRGFTFSAALAAYGTHGRTLAE
jgi:two-component system, cell cycle response regulator